MATEKKARRKPSGPRKVKPLFAVVGRNVETGKIECEKATRDASELLEVALNPPAALREKYGDTLDVIKIKVENTAPAATAPAAE